MVKNLPWKITVQEAQVYLKSPITITLNLTFNFSIKNSPTYYIIMF